MRRFFPENTAIEEISAKDLAEEYPAIRYNAPDGSFGVDILSRLGEAFSYDDLNYQEAHFEGMSIRVATPRMLYRMKKDTMRRKDRIDSQKIKERFSLEE